MRSVLKTLTITPTLDTNAYTSGDRMGSLVTLSSAFVVAQGRMNILSVNVIDKAKQNAAFEIILFNQQPTIASADNAAIDFTDANADYIVGVIPILTTDYTTAYGSNSQATKMNVNLVVQGAAPAANGVTGKALYALLVARGAPTYAASDLTIKLGAQEIM